MKAIFCILFFNLMLAGPVAKAFELQGFEVEAGTEIPLQVGARAKLQFNGNIHARAGLGFVPEFFADTYGDLAGSVGIHGSNTGSALAKAMAGSFTVDVRAGYSMDPDEGIYFEAGYLFMSGGSGSIDGEAAEDAIAIEYNGLDSNDDVTLEGSFHSLTFHAGYLMLLSERLSLNFDVGLVKPLMGDVAVSVSGTTTAVEEEFTDDFKPYLEEAVTNEMLIPTASVFVSYLF